MMSPKFEKLLQRIQKVQSFVETIVTQDLAFSKVAEELKNLSDTLKVGKLRVKIVSNSPILVESIQKHLINSVNNLNLTNIYQFKTIYLSSQTQENAIITSPPTVILKYNSGERSTCFPLPKNQKVLIGRSNNCQIQILDECALVSAHHAEIMPLVNSGFGKTDWQFRDTSSNGSYINGRKLLNCCQTLQAGDRIVLGYPEATQKSPELVIDFQFNPLSENENNDIEKQLTDCEVLYLVLGDGQILSDDEKHFLEKAIKAQVFKVVIVTDSSAINQEYQATVNNWIKSLNFSQSLVFISIPISYFDPNQQLINGIEQPTNLELNSFGHTLEDLANGEFEDVLKERVKNQFLVQINILDSLFKKQEDILKQEIQKLEGLLQKLSDQEINKILLEINVDKDQTFQQIRSKILESKEIFIHPYTKKSLLYKIRLFTEELKPVVTKKDSEVYLSLTSEHLGQHKNLNKYIRNDLCYKEIINWVNEEWKRICYNYANGGLNDLFHRTEIKLFKLTQTKNVPNSSFYSDKPNFDVYKYLQDSLVEFPSETSYQESGSPISGWVGLVISTIIGVLRLPTDPISTLMSFNSIMNILSGGNVKEKQAATRLEQQTENLKKGLCNHYQGLAKFLVEKMVQNCFLLSLLDIESRRFKESIELIKNEKIKPYINDIKKYLQDYKKQENALKNQQIELLQRIKGE